MSAHSSIHPSTLNSLTDYKLMKEGHGAGLSLHQATEAIRAIPQLLSIYHEDSRKPSMLYFYKQLNLSSKFIEEGQSELAPMLNGCDGSDLLSFAYLNSLGVDWDQIRLLLHAFPSLTHYDSEPGWEMLGHGPVRSELDGRMLMYLRKR